MHRGERFIDKSGRYLRRDRRAHERILGGYSQHFSYMCLCTIVVTILRFTPIQLQLRLAATYFERAHDLL